MNFLPISLKLKDQPCLVIGGEESAYNKALLLLKGGAQINLVAPTLCGQLQKLTEAKTIHHLSKTFSGDQLIGQKIVVVATDDGGLKQTVADAAEKENIPINVVDEPELCTFTMPSIIDRSPLTVAISTEGTSPTLARMIRSRIESMLPQPYGNLAKLLGSFRERCKTLYDNATDRRNFWNMIFASPIIEMFLSGRETAAKEALEKEFETAHDHIGKHGNVSLIGAGPGDPDLLTLRALRLIQNADAIVYDRLVSPVIMDYARRDAQKIYVGKRKSKHSVPQDQINQILVDLAKEGKVVVRLKGGDPFIFGRGGEELEKLIEDQIEFQVVPGVTSASGCGTYAGIPLTHRDYAQSCTLVTGHLKEGELDLNWEGLVQPRQTLVFYMGLSNINILTRELIRHGMSESMPAAVIQEGTTRNQKVYTGTLSTLAEIVKEKEVRPPTLIIIGEVVQLHNKLSWFKNEGYEGSIENVLFE